MSPDTLSDLDLTSEPMPLTATVAPPELMTQVTRAFFIATALVCGLAALLMLMLPRGAAGVAGTGWAQSVSAGLLVLWTVLALAGLRLPAVRHAPALTGLMAALVVTLTVSALWLGWGLAAPGLPALGLMVCVLCATAGWRAGFGLALLSLLCLVLLMVAGRWGGIGTGTGQPGAALLAPDWLQLGGHVILVLAGLAAGLALTALVARAMGAASTRERRFRSLLALAADGYWELDQHYKLVAAIRRDDESRALSAAGGLGAVPWDLTRFGCDADTLDLLQADLDNRVPFRDVAVRWASATDGPRRLLVSGEPRFSGRGVFKGYWGVVRDITDDIDAKEALVVTEGRYEELFASIPSPLVLHRNGRIFDANAAALMLFGFDELNAILGRDLLAYFESGDSRERARRRIEELHGEPVGTALPVADFRLLVRGRTVLVRATGVRVDAAGGPASLMIFVDDTERRAAEDAVRRSETMLQHLVATSPDLITLTDMATGRYAMVNRTFERVTGHRAADAVGKTSVELGVWRNTQEREHFVELVRSQGKVSDLATRFITKDGVSIAMMVSAARFVMDQRDYMVINARDVTESERARLEREAILANASVGIAVTRARRFVLANRCFEDMYGWPPGQLVGQPGVVVWGSESDYAELGILVGPKLARGEGVAIERTAMKRDGSSFLARIHGRAIDPARPAVGGTVWIVEDITERRQFERTLAQARDDAESASRAKSAFLANTSHELRTPLNGMIGLAQLARLPDISEPQRSQYLEQIADTAQSLAGIVSDILDLSKIEAGKLQIEATTFDLGALLRQLQRSYGTLAVARQLELVLEIDDGPAPADAAIGHVTGDPLRVRQIVTNFLTNALKFTEQGRVVLSARRQAEQVRIEVRDSGAGIDVATQARLFRPFIQADQSTTRRFGGTGLGLSICHELAGLMGGAVGVQSQPGEGSTFWATLHLPAAAAPAVQNDLTALGGGAEALLGRRVLMVEDNPVNMLIAVAMLERWGLQVEQAEDGRQALLSVQQASDAGMPFNAVLMDLQMPVMSGFEATRALRNLPAGVHLPIIAVTAAALVTEREQALLAGMDDFLTKPIDRDKLRAALLRWTAQSH